MTPDRSGLRLAEAGWMVHGWAGDRIGVIVERRDDLVLVRLDSISAKEVRIPVSLVADEDAAAKLVTLSVDTSELDGVEPQTDGVGLIDGRA